MPSYEKRVIRKQVGPVSLLVLSTGVRDVVSLQLSFESHPDFEAGGELVQDVVASMLDKGTRRRDRFEVATLLENRGARLSFSGAGVRFRASGRMLRDDVGSVVPLLGELLSEPGFDTRELEKTRKRLASSVMRAASDTGHRAEEALRRHVFGTGHPGFMHSPEELLEGIEALEPGTLQAFHSACFRGTVRCVVTGDVDPEELAMSVEQAFEGWTIGERSAPLYEDPPPTEPGSVRTPIRDRPNLDVHMGHGLDLRRDHEDFDALRMAVFALGGNFSARLMTRVRDEQGLTYGTGSSLSGLGIFHGGLWDTSITLSADRLDEGVGAARAELERFVSGGITATELTGTRETLSGRFTVGLATSGGLARTVLAAEENGFGVGYLDQYAGRLASVTLERANRAVREWLDPSRLFLSVAGSTGE